MPKTITINPPTAADATHIVIKRKDGVNTMVHVTFKMPNGYPGEFLVDTGSVPQEMVDSLEAFLTNCAAAYAAQEGL